MPEYEAVVQRAVVVSVKAFDWNCQQHITPRYTAAELEPVLAGMRQRIHQLEDQNDGVEARQSDRSPGQDQAGAAPRSGRQP